MTWRRKPGSFHAQLWLVVIKFTLEGGQAEAGTFMHMLTEHGGSVLGEYPHLNIFLSARQNFYLKCLGNIRRDQISSFKQGRSHDDIIFFTLLHYQKKRMTLVLVF